MEKLLGVKRIYINNITIQIKKKILDSYTIPNLTYGVQTWTITNIQTEKLAKTQTVMERSLTGIKRKDNIKNKIIQKRTGVKDIDIDQEIKNEIHARHIAVEGKIYEKKNIRMGTFRQEVGGR